MPSVRPGDRGGATEPEEPARARPLERLAVALALREMAALLAVRGGEPFRARAYERAAGALERHAEDLSQLVDQDRLTELPGIGRGIAAVIAELHRTGRSPSLERLRHELPAGALELSRVPGLRLDKIVAIQAALGVRTLPELEAAAEAGRLRSIRGIGEKTERRILDAVRQLKAPSAISVLLPDALEMSERLVDHLRAGPSVQRAELAGPLRRWVETIDELVALVVSPAPEAALDHASAFPAIAAITARGPGELTARLANGVALRVRATPEPAAATELLFATGTPGHLRDLQRLAQARGFALAPAAVTRAPGNATGTSGDGNGRRGRTPGPTRASNPPIAAAGEAQVYATLGLPWIPPELREGDGEVGAAAAGTLPLDLVDDADLRGAVHCHTVYSDGRHTVAEMARAAERLGMDYLTITDHSPSAHYAGGLSIDRLRAQWDEIARVQETVTVRLLRGTESDILADGALDYTDAVLEQLDVVIASVHQRHRMDADQMTRRLVRAMEHPYFKVWGHALGRLLLSRPPFDCRVEEVLDAAARSRAAIEINGDPRRLDLPPRWLRAARERGLRFVVSTDAHSTGELANTRFGAAMARRGGVRRGEVLNALGAEAFARAVAPSGRSRWR